MDGSTLIFGAGWIGTAWSRRLGATLTRTDIASEEAVRAELARCAPARVINAAGATGNTSVDALEGDPARAYRSNVVGPLVLASACAEAGIPFVHLGSGCIYEGDAGGQGWTEEDAPNFGGSLYARTKALAEQALSDFDVLQLRIRLPLSATPGPRNLLTKLLSFDRVVSVPNSVTVLEDFWPVAEALIQRGERGIWNLVNDGVERHDELLRVWREHVDPDHSFDVISVADLESRLVARRSNCVLSTAKLAAAGLGLPPLDESLPRLVLEYAAGPS
ncbi:MAG: sugar nucleotide-binding protein [Planctomycetota bacterium]|nr:sugar nucleotide-binding protein [Planctomycetota bacterium]